MSSFSLHVSTDNAAFAPSVGSEVARLLRVLAEDLDDGEIEPDDLRYGANEGTVRDANGNTVGRWFWTDRAATHDDAAALDMLATGRVDRDVVAITGRRHVAEVSRK